MILWLMFIGGPSWQNAANSALYFIVFSLVGLAIAASLNLAGLNIGKWLHNLGAIGFWAPHDQPGGVGPGELDPVRLGYRVHRGQPGAEHHLKDIIFWSTITFSLSGLESAFMMGDEIKAARRNISGALLVAGMVITVLYILATVALLVAMPRDQILNLQGFMTAIISISDRIGLGGIGVLAGALVYSVGRRRQFARVGRLDGRWL